jgi:predicted amidophosphoribosyltransferase
MQLAGKICSSCQQNVILDADATWCARCSNVIHRGCLAQSDGICPACRKMLEDPEPYFVFSRLCPQCFRRNDPPEPVCPRCHTRTRWDNQPALDQFAAEMRQEAGMLFIRGLAELAAALLCLIGIASLFFGAYRPPIVPIGAACLGLMTLAPDGIYRLVRSRKLARFQ